MSILGIVLMAGGLLTALLPLVAPHYVPLLMSEIGEFECALAGIAVFGIGFGLLLMGMRRRRHRRMQQAAAQDDPLRGSR